MALRISEDEVQKIVFNLDEALRRVNLTKDDLRKLRKLVEQDEEVPGRLKDWFVSIEVLSRFRGSR